MEGVSTVYPGGLRRGDKINVWKNVKNNDLNVIIYTF